MPCISTITAVLIGLQAIATAAQAQYPGSAPNALPHDLSPLAMIQNADVVVKLVLIGLVLASIGTWTVALAKGIEIVSARRREARALATLRASADLDEAKNSLTASKSVVRDLVDGAVVEWQRSRAIALSDPIKERTALLLKRREAQAGRQMSRGTGVLATIGAVAPFVGLFGTVWGIMNSFVGISKAQTSNLAVVAPGIAEALLATAVGLAAAIPAVVFYNIFARAIAGYRAELADAAAEVLRLLGRDLDRAASPSAAPAQLRAAE